MTIERIPRYNASVDGETVFLRDAPKGSLINATMLIGKIQVRIANIRDRVYDCPRDSFVRSHLNGQIDALEEILLELGENPL